MREKMSPEEYKKLFNLEKITSQDARILQVYNEGPLFTKAREICEDEYGADLMVPDCGAVLDRVYGKRLKRMRPETIYNKIESLMLMVISNPDTESIEDEVEYILS